MLQKVVGFLIYGVLFVIGWALLIVYSNFGFHIVEGPEMMPGIRPEDYKIVSKPGPNLIHELKPGDIVHYQYHKPGFDRQVRWLGRVIALPGDRVRIDLGEVSVNGKKIAQDYVNPQAKTLETLAEVVVPRDSVYVLHDNRKHLTMRRTFGFSDSRAVGPIGIHAILGKF